MCAFALARMAHWVVPQVDVGIILNRIPQHIAHAELMLRAKQNKR